MCGISGALVDGDATGLVFDALKRLEYRGYDSAGIATLTSDGIVDRRRASGKLIHLGSVLKDRPLVGGLSIGHTRWATHGPATEGNAHPHSVGRVTVVHNGIIENYVSLKNGLEGWVPQSETDSEVIAALINQGLVLGMLPEQAFAGALMQLEGMYAVLMVLEGDPERFWFARQGSPLALGFGSLGIFAGSDAIALAGLADTLMHLEDGDWGVVSREDVLVFDPHGAPVWRERVPMPVSSAAIEKAGHRHFMAKEIAEQPVALADAIKAHVRSDVALWGSLDIVSCARLEILACGTACLAAEVGRHWFESLAALSTGVTVASEARHRPLLGDPQSVTTMVVSQSGETADTLQAMKAAALVGRKTVAVVNVETSSMARQADVMVPLHVGPEIGVASTKAFTGQLVALRVLALQAAFARGHLDKGALRTHWEALERLPALMATAIASIDGVCAAIGRELAPYRSALFLGRGMMAPLAEEAALKLKEISYIHAEGYPAGELKHGPIALIDDQMPVVVFAPRGETFEKTLSSVHEVRARHGKVILVSDSQGIAQAGEGCWHTVVMPDISEDLAPILYAVPAQLLAYHTAVARGTDVDQPRNLAKSVTVE